MTKPLVIVGGGIAGTCLALQCYRRNIPVQLYHIPGSGEASSPSSGLINPITGRRYVKSWMIDQFLKEASAFYSWTESLVGRSFYRPVEITRFIMNDEAAKAWNKRLGDPEYSAYILSSPHENLSVSNVPFGVVGGCWRLDVQGWLHAMHTFLYGRSILKHSFYDLHPSSENVITINTRGALDEKSIPGLVPNKGESLVCWMPDWKIPGISKQQVYVIPLNSPDTYWVGSLYDPWPNHPFPTNEGRMSIESALQAGYRGRLEVISHHAGVRPTVEDRRPIIGEHPFRRGEYIFTGLGTKGTSLAPYWSLKLIESLMDDLPLPQEVLSSRFS